MKKENIFRKEFEEVQNNDVYVYYQDRNMDSSLIIGFSQNYVEFLEMLASQGNVCKICKKSEPNQEDRNEYRHNKRHADGCKNRDLQDVHRQIKSCGRTDGS